MGEKRRRSKQFGLMLEGEFEKRMAAFQLKFVADIRPVLFDGSLTDEKLLTNFLASQFLCN